MHISSYQKMYKFMSDYLINRMNEELKVVDIGSQDVQNYYGTYKPMMVNTKWEYIGCDMVAGKNVDVVLEDVYDWKELESNFADVVISGQAFEHIEYFWVTIMEISRILKEDGLCCIIAPSSGPEHRYPVDCWRYYPDGFRALAKFAGLKVLEVYTEWEEHDYPDGGGMYKDSVLICQKAKLKESEKIKLDKKIELVKTLVRDYEINI
ncbi:methyltransferase domain-containing protein [Romboutsia weinsteinii]|uniref:Methyltransferase domain-containing protein n=1 Tax=Romboutsia weinsteinii TaxID=2020949 RepID=A0A371J7A2_9FIRM|nr:methyltransferase domain-containing protein [Romboutsia weinsteinii]RDY28583.1 methyltransferase domain-containing protein [Romboutsia weinsteinii]